MHDTVKPLRRPGRLPRALPVLLSLCVAGCEAAPVAPEPGLVEPILRFLEMAPLPGSDGEYLFYSLQVENWSDYSDELFMERPDLPPCGLNDSASRTWLEIFDGLGVRRYGYCGIARSVELQGFGFSVLATQEQPIAAFIELWDRELGVRVRSNQVALQ